MTLKVPIIFGGEFYFTLRSQFALGTWRALGSHGTSTEITPDLLTPAHCLHPQHQSLLLNLSFFTNELFIWDIMQDLSLGVFPCIVQRAAAQSARFQRNTKLFLIWWGNFSVEVQAREFGESPESASLSSNNSPLAIVLEHMALQENENHHFNSIYFYWFKFCCMFSVMTLGNVSKCWVGANSVNPMSRSTWNYKDIIYLFRGKSQKYFWNFWNKNQNSGLIWRNNQGSVSLPRALESKSSLSRFSLDTVSSSLELRGGEWMLCLGILGFDWQHKIVRNKARNKAQTF